jgi:hypothetical protein
VNIDVSFHALVVIDDFDIICIVTVPAEAHAVLIVNANAMLARTLPFQGFQMVAGRTAQLVDRRGCFKLS